MCAGLPGPESQPRREAQGELAQPGAAAASLGWLGLARQRPWGLFLPIGSEGTVALRPRAISQLLS